MPNFAPKICQPAVRGAVLAAPAVIYLLAFLAVPLALVAATSVLSRGPYGEVIFKLTADNYTRLFDPLYLNILLDSLTIAGATTAVTLLIGYPLAWWMARAPRRVRSAALFALLVPFWTNFLIRIYAWILILRSGGLLEGLLAGLGLWRGAIEILYTPWAVLIGMVYEFLPFMVLPLFASLEKIDEAQLAAAADLGARPFQVFWRVVLPLGLPGLVAGSTLVFVPAMGMFALPDLMGGARTLLVGNLIRNQFLVARDWPFGAAAAMVLVTLTLALLVLYTRFAGKETLV
ncbi:ABC transporter permease [Gloeobacter morelensis MG652769]|uniref:ABC transporter permease n=1 Tax=Gloeobacter morelensis MG652769 TaxID=2781736 RepID=A0ABY3PPF6_9CYAN|nr:ABC transporter permease [Gloeobacter morelensis MG652769]